jgi:hypothetical protein
MFIIRLQRSLPSQSLFPLGDHHTISTFTAYRILVYSRFVACIGCKKHKKSKKEQKLYLACRYWPHQRALLVHSLLAYYVAPLNRH